jgi:uncharacterized protein
MYQVVEFPSEGAILRGRLYSNPDLPKPLPIVIMAHGFSATLNGMVADRYAESFAEAGLTVLLYDHYSFGISGGEPRRQINKWVQVRGYRDAINFVTTLPEIDTQRIALWGDSMSGAEVIVVGALDSRVKSIVAQVPACGDEPPPLDPDGLLFSTIRETFQSGDVTGTPDTTTGPLPVVSFDQQSIPSLLTPLTAFRWFIEYGGRFGTGWENSASLVAPTTPAPLHPALCAPYIRASLLMVVARDDEMPGAATHIVQKTFDVAPQPKEYFTIEGGHFGLLYYPSPLFDQVSKLEADFLGRRLK